MTGSILREADLRGANFQDANLIGADLEGANLQGALNLTIEQLAVVCTLHRSQLNQSIMEQIGSKYPHLFKKPDRDKDGVCIGLYPEY